VAATLEETAQPIINVSICLSGNVGEYWEPHLTVESAMIDLKYSLVIEATDDPTFFSFHSPDLPGFSGVGHSVEDCLYQADGAWRSNWCYWVNRASGFPGRRGIQR